MGYIWICYSVTQHTYQDYLHIQGLVMDYGGREGTQSWKYHNSICIYIAEQSTFLLCDCKQSLQG